MEESWNDQEEIAANETEQLSEKMNKGKKRQKLNKRWKRFGIIALTVGMFSFFY